MKIVILLFDNFTALDVAGPYDVLNKLPNSKVHFVGFEKKEYKDTHGLTIYADYSADDISQADIVLIPGGAGIDSLLKRKNY